MKPDQLAWIDPAKRRLTARAFRSSAMAAHEEGDFATYDRRLRMAEALEALDEADAAAAAAEVATQELEVHAGQNVREDLTSEDELSRVLSNISRHPFSFAFES